MRLDKLGWEEYRKTLEDAEVDAAHTARVLSENRTNYTLATESGELLGVLRGKTHYTLDAESVPKVGDWVVFSDEEQSDVVAIESILPRHSKLSRMAAGDEKSEQVMVANIDQVFIVQGLDGNFNLNRLERYLVMADQGGATPIIVLNKMDLVENPEEYEEQVRELSGGAEVVVLSATEGENIELLHAYLTAGSTSVFVGSSGVGKSTLLNQLLGEERQETQGLRDDDQGKHTTTRRELFILPNGAIIIDTPGMRELHLSGAEGVEEMFDDLEELAQSCKYRDCDHDQSDDCALKAAVEEGKIEPQRLANYLKIGRELDFEESKIDHDRGVARKARIRKTQKGYKKILKEKYDARDSF